VEDAINAIKNARSREEYSKMLSGSSEPSYGRFVTMEDLKIEPATKEEKDA
jgi:hypothetical protein